MDKTCCNILVEPLPTEVLVASRFAVFFKRLTDL